MNFGNKTNDNSNQGVASNYGISFSISLIIQVIIGGWGCLANGVLLYAQSLTDSWPFYQRRLFFNVTVASLITATIYSFQGLVQVAQFRRTGSGFLWSWWANMPGSTGHVAVAFGMAMLTYQNLFALRQCCKYIQVSDKKRLKYFKTGFMIAAVWLLAFGAVVVGLNPYPTAADDNASVMTYMSYGSYLFIQISVGAAIWRTVRTTKKLETDFAARGAQQSLQMRTHIKETIALTSVIVRVITLHVVTWIASLSAAFAIHLSTEITLTRSSSMDHSEKAKMAGLKNEVEAYAGFVDCIALLFEATYPLTLAWRQPKIQKGIKNLICSFKNLSESSSVSAASDIVANKPNGSGHHRAIGDHWEMIAKTQKRGPVISEKGVKVVMPVIQ